MAVAEVNSKVMQGGSFTFFPSWYGSSALIEAVRYGTGLKECSSNDEQQHC
jgi:hypothetical protein